MSSQIFKHDLYEYLKTTEIWSEKGTLGCYQLNIVLAGKQIRICVDNQQLLEYFTWQMRLMIVPEKDVELVPFAELYLRIDSGLKKLTDLSDKSYLFINFDETDTKVKINNGKVINGSLFAYCRQTRKGLFLIDPIGLPAFMGVSHNLTPLFAFMAEDLNAVTVHGAVVGRNDVGLMIGGVSGAGKSTLAIAALSEGWQYVSDDTILLNVSTRKAYPVCSTCHIGPDMYQRMPEMVKLNMPMYQGRANKRHIDITKLSRQFYQGLEIKAVVSPEIHFEKQPGFEKVKKEQVIMPIMFSSAAQLNNDNDDVLLRKILHALLPLPTYRLDVNVNLAENVKVLAEIIYKVSNSEEKDD